MGSPAGSETVDVIILVIGVVARNHAALTGIFDFDPIRIVRAEGLVPPLLADELHRGILRDGCQDRAAARAGRAGVARAGAAGPELHVGGPDPDRRGPRPGARVGDLV